MKIQIPHFLLLTHEFALRKRGLGVLRLFDLLVLFCARQGGGIASKRAMTKRARVLKINAKQKPNQIAF